MLRSGDEVRVNDDGVYRLGVVEQVEGEWVWVRLASRLGVRSFWIETVMVIRFAGGTDR